MAQEPAGAESGERTEPATPKRRERAREEGQIALSRELAPALLLAGLAASLGIGAPLLARALTDTLTPLLSRAELLRPETAVRAALGGLALSVLPVAALAASCAAVAALGQTGLLLRPAALRPSLARLDPLAGLRRLFGPTSLAEAARSVVKLGVVGVAGWVVLAEAIPLSLASISWSPVGLLDHVRRLALRLVLIVLAAQALLAALDVLRARMALAGRLRMSRQEIREEHREAEGDPQIKARIRRLRSQRARQRMMAAVPRATVVVTNPTHYAIALAYERGSAGAPRVVAKGIDAMAARIREAAQQARVPMIANPPLARALWRIELEEEVPAELFQAVAEVIAAVWRLRAPRAGL